MATKAEKKAPTAKQIAARLEAGKRMRKAQDWVAKNRKSGESHREAMSRYFGK
jgi:hypothetical protein